MPFSESSLFNECSLFQFKRMFSTRKLVSKSCEEYVLMCSKLFVVKSQTRRNLVGAFEITLSSLTFGHLNDDGNWTFLQNIRKHFLQSFAYIFNFFFDFLDFSFWLKKLSAFNVDQTRRLTIKILQRKSYALWIFKHSNWLKICAANQNT